MKRLVAAAVLLSPFALVGYGLYSCNVAAGEAVAEADEKKAKLVIDRPTPAVVYDSGDKLRSVLAHKSLADFEAFEVAALNYDEFATVEVAKRGTRIQPRTEVMLLYRESPFEPAKIQLPDGSIWFVDGQLVHPRSRNE